MTDFLAGLHEQVPPGPGRPLVVHDEDLRALPAGEVHNPTALRIVGDLPTLTFELFKQVFGPGASSDMQRHHHETVHYVVSGDGHSEIEDEVVTWTTGSFVYTPPWTWHRHHNDSPDAPVEFLTIENSRLLALLGVPRRQSAGEVGMAEARTQFGGHPS
jgi:gentisate 1,2-dioxygenase